MEHARDAGTPRGFKGYDPGIGEICFTCYLEMLRVPENVEEKADEVLAQVA